jgi:hypothetical protein
MIVMTNLMKSTAVRDESLTLLIIVLFMYLRGGIMFVYAMMADISAPLAYIKGVNRGGSGDGAVGMFSVYNVLIPA